jgi:hypothetical protein
VKKLGFIYGGFGQVISLFRSFFKKNFFSTQKVVAQQKFEWLQMLLGFDLMGITLIKSF